MFLSSCYLQQQATIAKTMAAEQFSQANTANAIYSSPAALRTLELPPPPPFFPDTTRAKNTKLNKAEKQATHKANYAKVYWLLTKIVFGYNFVGVKDLSKLVQPQFLR